MADIALEELRRRVGAGDLVVLDVRSPHEYSGEAGYPCDPRQGHIPGARNVPLDRLLQCGSLDEVHELVGVPAGREVVAYCHSGSRSRYAVEMLAAAGYDARNYLGSWHEWSRDPELPAGSSAP